MDVLERLLPVSEGYAIAPIADAFNWVDAGSDLGDGAWYLVAFRSIRRSDADEARLTQFDDLAHAEAVGSRGFVHYFKGPRAADGTCLSFCLWHSREDARAAARQPAHMAAVSLLDEMYESYTLEFHRVTRVDGGRLTFEPYDQPGVPQHIHASGPALHPQPAAPHPATGSPPG